MDDVIVTKHMLGLCFMQACVKKGTPDDVVLRECNIKNPAGTTNGWMSIIKTLEEGGKWGDLTPVECEDYPDRQHLIIAC